MSSKEPPILRRLGLVLLIILVTALIIGSAAVILYAVQFGTSLFDDPDQYQWAGFGDYVGGVLGPLFAFFGLIALLLTIWIQSRELRRSSEALTEQNKSIKLQSFENRFFNMISLHHEIVKGIDLRKKGEVVSSGRDCLKVFYERLRTELKPALRGDSIEYKDGLLTGYEAFYDQHAHELGHYFRNIYRILKFIDESDVPRKTEYSGILRAQLSNPELGLLFYNGITVRGDKLKPLAEQYALFENLEPDQLVRKQEDSMFYEAGAFGEHIGLFMGVSNG